MAAPAAGRCDGDRRFTTIATGAIRTCAVGDVGDLFCWGRVPEAAADDRCLDSNGVAGTNDCVTRPARVHPAGYFRAVAIGASHQCGLFGDGSVMCWGDNEAGQIGNASLHAAASPAYLRVGGVSRIGMRVLDWRDRAWWVADHFGAGMLIGLAAGLPLVWWTARWWRRRPAAGPAPSVSLGARVMGGAALAGVLAAWTYAAYATVALQSSPATGDVGGGLAAFAWLVIMGTATGVSTMAGVFAAFVARNHRGAVLARIALVLSGLTLAAAAVLALVLFGPWER